MLLDFAKELELSVFPYLPENNSPVFYLPILDKSKVSDNKSSSTTLMLIDIYMHIFFN